VENLDQQFNHGVSSLIQKNWTKKLIKVLKQKHEFFIQTSFTKHSLQHPPCNIWYDTFIIATFTNISSNLLKYKANQTLSHLLFCTMSRRGY
jgi:hypothetical protein